MTAPAEWRSLLESFVEGRMSGPDFERAFLDAWRHDRDNGIRVARAVDTLFYEVDAYCADPALRGPNDIDEAALLAATREALARFDEPWPERPGEETDLQQLDAIRRTLTRLSF